MSVMVELEGIVVDIKVLVYYTKWGARDKAQGVLQASSSISSRAGDIAHNPVQLQVK